LGSTSDRGSPDERLALAGAAGVLMGAGTRELIKRATECCPRRRGGEAPPAVDQGPRANMVSEPEAQVMGVRAEDREL
jgi:hypothetical protein